MKKSSIAMHRFTCFPRTVQVARAHRLVIFAAALGVGLPGCGGGGDAEPADEATPTSGHYAWVLRAEGPTDAIRYGLSLIHPAQPGTEFVVEAPSDSVTDAKVVTRASVDVSTRSTGTLAPYALVYVRGGDVRRVPLAANGEAPAARLQRAQTSSACRFVLDALDHAAPERSRFMLSTAGADGRCDTSDDGRAEVRLDATLGLALTPWSGAAPLAALRDPTTLAPRGWLTGTELRLWSTNGNAPQVVPLRPDSDPLQRAVLVTPRGVVAESASGMSVIEFGAGASFAETSLPGLGGRGWQALGFDATHHYLYRNAASALVESWSIARVHRTTHVVTTIASGAGQVVLASLGRDVAYVTVANGHALELKRASKAVAGMAQPLASGSLAASFFAVLTGAEGVHMMWLATALDSANPQHRIDIVDETGLVLRAGRAGGFSLGLAEAERIDFERSENRDRFLFAEGYGARFFGDATLQAFDSRARASVEVGSLPGRAEFGDDAVFANVLAGPQARAAGFASRASGGFVQGEGARVFSFDPTQARSLVTTTRRR